MRVFFRKEGRAAYCSHLDLIRTVTRAMVRAKIPTWYTQGFNPHLYMTFSLPLSLGVASCCESLDFRLVGEMPYDEIASRFNDALPEGLRVTKADSPIFKPKDIAWADYRVDLLCSAKQLADAVESLNKKTEIPIEKKSKKGLKIIDIKPLFTVLAAGETQQGACLNLRCRAGIETNLNPVLVLDRLSRIGNMPAGQLQITRTAVLIENLEDFR